MDTKSKVFASALSVPLSVVANAQVFFSPNSVVFRFARSDSLPTGTSRSHVTVVSAVKIGSDHLWTRPSFSLAKQFDLLLRSEKIVFRELVRGQSHFLFDLDHIPHPVCHTLSAGFPWHTLSQSFFTLFSKLSRATFGVLGYSGVAGETC